MNRGDRLTGRRSHTAMLGRAALAGTLLAGIAGAALAGQACRAEPLSPQAMVQGLTLAQKTAEALDAEHARSGARVVLLARAGQDLTRYGLHWSHAGWAYKTDAGPWRVLHKLNACGTAHSAIWRHGLGEFFLDDLWRAEATWTVPAPALQQPLLRLLQDPQAGPRLHERAYSMVSYAWGTRYQQSNQWALETLAMAAEPAVAQRPQAQAWLRFKGYQPAVMRIGAMTRLGARVGMANVAFDDHPHEQRYAGRIETVTVESMLDWLPRAGLGSAPQRLSL